MLFSLILHFVLIRAVQDVLTFDYTKVLEPLTGKEVRGVKTEDFVDSLLQSFLNEFKRCLLVYRKEGTF